jgi:methionyl-tRNA formyltransferase
MSKHEEIIIDIEVGDKMYEVTIIEIEEVVDNPDGSGEIPIVYQTMPPINDEETQQKLHEELTKFFHSAINKAIQEAMKNDKGNTC